MKLAKVCQSPPQITELFEWTNEQPYNLRHNAHFLQPFVNSVYFETESISYLGPKIWGLVRDGLYNFKKVIKKWKVENCPIQGFCQKYRVLWNCLNYYVFNLFLFYVKKLNWSLRKFFIR